MSNTLATGTAESLAPLERQHDQQLNPRVGSIATPTALNTPPPVLPNSQYNHASRFASVAGGRGANAVISQQLLQMHHTHGNQHVARKIAHQRARQADCAPRIQRADATQEDPAKRAQQIWIDLTCGLTNKQHKALSGSFTYTKALTASAKEPPNWKAIYDQYAPLLTIVSKIALNISAVTSSARTTLTPAINLIEDARDLTSGAKEPLIAPNNKRGTGDLIEQRMKEARVSLELEVLHEQKLGGVVYSDTASFEKLIADMHNDPHHPIRINLGLTFFSATKEQQLRQKYAPPTAQTKQILRDIVKGFDQYDPFYEKHNLPLKRMLATIEQWLPITASLKQDTSIGAVYRIGLEKAHRALELARAAIQGQLDPITNTLRRIRTAAREIETVIQKTLDLQRRHDPNEPDDGIIDPIPSDMDSNKVFSPAKETRNLKNQLLEE